MKNNSKIKPERLTPFTNPFGCGYLNYLVEQNDEGDYTYESVYYDSLNRDSIINLIIRDKYSQDMAEAITQNHLTGDNHEEFYEFQKWRKVAKLVADGLFWKADIDAAITDYAPVSRIDDLDNVTTEVVQTLNDKGIIP